MIPPWCLLYTSNSLGLKSLPCRSDDTKDACQVYCGLSVLLLLSSLSFPADCWVTGDGFPVFFSSMTVLFCAYYLRNVSKFPLRLFTGNVSCRGNCLVPVLKNCSVCVCPLPPSPPHLLLLFLPNSQQPAGHLQRWHTFCVSCMLLLVWLACPVTMFPAFSCSSELSVWSFHAG